MNADLSEILNSWEYDPENCIRILVLDNNREVLQVRQPLGIEQYELEGRPDGKKGFNGGTALAECTRKLKQYMAINKSDKGFILGLEDFKLLQNEGLLYYYRYLLLFQLGEFERTANDTDHNLKICELVEKYMEAGKEQKQILQYRPYILRLNAISNAMISLQHKLKPVARKILKSAIEMIEKMPVIDTPQFNLEKKRSIKYLTSTLEQLGEEEVPLQEQLQLDLEDAVANENYEEAARIRDKLRTLKETET